ncbi:MAG: DUF1592 domain-containing protein [Vicinamibacterales bacterium]
MAAIGGAARHRRYRALTPVLAVAFVLATAARAASPAQDAGPSGVMHRLTERQYRNTIADIFGEDVEVTGHVRRGPVSEIDLQEYERMARGIAAQVVDGRHRQGFVACVPRNVTLPDDACTATFFRGIGHFIFRRPLTLTEVQTQVAAARAATDITRDFYAGLGASLATMLVSPTFLFDIDAIEPDRARAGSARLGAYSRASRLSLFLWNTSPDAALLEAATRGELETAAGVTTQVDRLMASPRLARTIAAVLSDAVVDAEGCALPELPALERAVRDKAAVPACLTERISEFALRRSLRADEKDWMTDLTGRFVKSGHDVRLLFRNIATSEAFLRVVPAK